MIKERYITREVLRHPDYDFGVGDIPRRVCWVESVNERFVGIDNEGVYWTCWDEEGEPSNSCSWQGMESLMNEHHVLAIFEEDIAAIRANIDPDWNPPQGMYTCKFEDW